jgi:hypothetical protein
MNKIGAASFPLSLTSLETFTKVPLPLMCSPFTASSHSRPPLSLSPPSLVPQCAPMLDVLPVLIDTLNKTKDFYQFLKRIRAEFVTWARRQQQTTLEALPSSSPATSPST